MASYACLIKIPMEIDIEGDISKEYNPNHCDQSPSDNHLLKNWHG